jgi:chitodextrinase
VIRFRKDTMWDAASTWVRRPNAVALAAVALASLTILSPAGAEERRLPRPPAEVRLASVTTSSISLAWKAPAKNQRVGHVAGYGLYLNGTRVAATKTLSYTFDGLACGKTYAVGVDSYAGSGRRSEVVTLTASTAPCAAAPPPPPPPPPPPQPPAPGDTSPPSTPVASATAANATSVSLTWTASTDNVGVKGYDLYRNSVKVGTTADTRYTFGSLVCATSYTLGIEAFDAAGNRSTRASLVAATSACPTSGLSVPTSVAADCSRDVTAELQSWINSVPNGATLTFGAGACYRVEGVLLVQGRSGLTFEGKGSTLRATTIGDGHRSTFRFKDGGGHTVRAFTIEGGYTAQGIHKTDVQWSHGVELLGTQGALIENLTVRNVAGDCVYLGLGAARTRDATVRDVTCTGTGRNGVSFVAADRSRVERGTYTGIGLIAFDVEPNDIAGFGVDGATVDGATVGSYYLDVGMVIGTAPISNVTFANIVVTAAKGARFRVLTPTTLRRTTIAFTGNTAKSTLAGDAIYVERTDGLTVTGNAIPTTGVLLRCAGVTRPTFFGNSPNTASSC